MVTPNKRENPVIATCYACLAHLRDVSLRRDSIASFASSLLPASSSSSSPPSLPSLPSSPGESWSQEPLHPIPARRTPGEISDWIFTVSLLNFSFWSELQEDERYAVRWKNGVDGKGASGERDWTGYWSLPAAINRGRAESPPSPGRNRAEGTFLLDFANFSSGRWHAHHYAIVLVVGDRRRDQTRLPGYIRKKGRHASARRADTAASRGRQNTSRSERVTYWNCQVRCHAILTL